MSIKKKVLILDRDGVINHDPTGYISSPEAWQPIPGSLSAIATLNRAGWHVFVVTNQSGIGRGYYDLEDLSRIHEKMLRALAAEGGYIEEIFYCPHEPEAKCDCRKPAPGLFLDLQKKFDIDLTQAFFVGDKLSDVRAARAVGCQPILVLTGNGRQTMQDNPALDVPCFADLAAFAMHLLQLAASPEERGCEKSSKK